MKTISLLVVLVFSGHVFANNCKSDEQAALECCEFIKSMNHTKTNRLQTFDKSVCTLSVYHRDSDTSYRRFGFGSDGQVSIFMQPGGNKQKTNSSQSYLIFPFGEYPTAKYNADEKLHVRSGSGQQWTFNTQNSLPVAIDGCNISVSSKFSLQDSGVKIKSCKQHLVIETPVDVGGEYIAYADKALTVSDPSQKTCQIKNSDLYEYKKDKGSYKDPRGRYYNIKMKYKSNRELGMRLQKICPNLDVSMLFKENSSGSRKIDPAEEKRARDILEGQTQN